MSVPFTTSRARMRSASLCLILEPVRTISSPLLKLTPMSSRKDLGQRYTSTVSVPVFTQQVGNLFLTTFRRQFHFLHGAFHLGLGVDVVFGRACFPGFLRNEGQSTEKYDGRKDQLPEVP